MVNVSQLKTSDISRIVDGLTDQFKKEIEPYCEEVDMERAGRRFYTFAYKHLSDLVEGKTDTGL